MCRMFKPRSRIVRRNGLAHCQTFLEERKRKKPYDGLAVMMLTDVRHHIPYGILMPSQRSALLGRVLSLDEVGKSNSARRGHAVGKMKQMEPGLYIRHTQYNG